MKIQLTYGRSGLAVTLPDDTHIFSPIFKSGLPNEAVALQHGLRNPIGTSPLQEKVRDGHKVAIVHTDITRATPNDRILPILLQELQSAGVRQEDITFINGLGTHRPQTKMELRQMLGDSIVDGYKCQQHDCYDNLVSLGKTSQGHPVRINRTYLESDIKILTGFIEPHFFAGFSGGPKAVLPSLAGAESVFTNHGYDMLSHPLAVWGITKGNPIWEEMYEVALLTKPDFLLNVTLNTHHEITGVFAGDLLAAHRQGCDFVRTTAMAPFKKPYDVVITSNSGYPLDQNLYQSVKGLSAAARVVRPGGAILLIAACEDGLPNHGRYIELLQKAGSSVSLLNMIAAPGFEAQDQWQVQIQAQIQQLAEVHVFSEGLTSSQIQQALLNPCRNINKTLQELIARKGSRVCVLPEGPQVIPYLET